MLTYEIEQALDRYELPLIVTYVDYDVVADPEQLSSYWPTALRERISNKTARAIHIPFTEEALLHAINQFDDKNLPTSSLECYTKSKSRGFSISVGLFVNTKKKK